jgi:hypothetical protein
LERWDFVSGPSVYREGERSGPTGPDSRFDLALGALRPKRE